MSHNSFDTLNAPIPPDALSTSPVHNPAPLIHLTEAARHRMNELADKYPDLKGLRVSLTSSGCAGLKYDCALVKEITPTDSVIHAGRLHLFVDPIAEIYLAGSTLDYVDTGLGATFDFINPNEVRRCGCGKSFTPKAQSSQACSTQ